MPIKFRVENREDGKHIVRAIEYTLNWFTNEESDHKDNGTVFVGTHEECMKYIDLKYGGCW